jgi:hypothetical protein
LREGRFFACLIHTVTIGGEGFRPFPHAGPRPGQISAATAVGRVPVTAAPLTIGHTWRDSLVEENGEGPGVRLRKRIE